MFAWIGTAHADDQLDRNVNFQIPASSLGRALLEFSAQSGIKVAAGDSDVSKFDTPIVSGTFPIRTALSMLLQGTGLEFTPVGAETVAIHTPAAGVVSLPPQKPDDVTVKMPGSPEAQELAGDSLYQFIVHHGTVHYENTGTSGNLAHWRGGRQSICPVTGGLDPASNALVTARLRAVTKYVGAPLASDPNCKYNVSVVFTTNPDKEMKDVTNWAERAFGQRYRAIQRVIQFTDNHAIQGWYLTTPWTNSVMNTDLDMIRVNLQPLWPQIIQNGLKDRGDMRTIVGAMFIVDTRKVAGYLTETVADYLSILTLSVAQTPDHCDPLPSILDDFAATCEPREKPEALTAGDLAFLKGLYYRNTGIGSSLSRDEIRDYMMQTFKGSAPQ